MTTTVMRDSIVGDAWIQQTATAVPVQWVKNDKGEQTLDLLTGPVRLSWPNLFRPPAATKDNANPKIGTALLFTPYVDWTLFYQEYYRICAASFSQYYDATTQQYVGLRSPFRQQSEKLKFEGYTPGLVFMTCTTKFKPPLVDIRGNPVVDESKVYPGVWAICSVNAYPNTDNRTRGVRFGLQTVMLIGDDKQLGGGGANAAATYAGIAGRVNAPIVRPDVAASFRQPAAPGMPGAPIPGIPGTSGYPAYSIPQQTYAPPPPTPGGDDDDYSFMR